MPTSGHVAAFGLHHKGNVRDQDQDYLLYWGDPGLDVRPVDLRECLDPSAGSRFLSPTRLFVIADGMGGLAEGASAARTACHTAFNAFRSLSLRFNLYSTDHLGGLKPDTEVDWDDATLPHLTRGLAEAAQQVLLQALEAANEPVWREGQGRWGSTLLAAAICDQQVLLAAAGDCRAYLLRPSGRLELLTKDDNLAWEATASGRISYAEATEDGLTSRLTKYLGMGPRVNPTGYATGLAAGGRLILCTDGLYSSFNGERPVARLARGEGVREAAERLLAAALARGGHDNVSALVIDVPAGHGPPVETLLPPTPVIRQKPGVQAWLRQQKRRAAAERWGMKSGIAGLLCLALAAGLWLSLEGFQGRAESAPSLRVENGAAISPTPPRMTAPVPTSHAAFGSGAGPVTCEPAPGQVCPQPGETLEGLAARLGVDPRTVTQLNHNVPSGVPLRQDVPLWVTGVPPSPPAPSTPAVTPTGLPVATPVSAAGGDSPGSPGP